jgi:hypothetical protein
MQLSKNVNSKLIKNISDYIAKVKAGYGTGEDVKKIEVLLLELKTLPRPNNADEWLSTLIQIKQIEAEIISLIPYLILKQG